MERNRITAIFIFLILVTFGLLYTFSFYKDLWSNSNINVRQLLKKVTFTGEGKLNIKHETKIEVYKDGRCQKLEKLKQVLLAVNYNWPHYSSIPILKEMYGGIFGKVVFCGNGDHPEVIKVRGSKGYLGYDCAANAIRKFPNFIGYLQTNDDVLLNWWNLMELDISKVWSSVNIPHHENYFGFGHEAPDPWWWWNDQDIPRRCDATFYQLGNLSNSQEGLSFNFPKHLERYFTNTKRKYMCTKGQSDVFYIPQQFSKAYEKLSDIFIRNNVFLETALPTILLFFKTETNLIVLNGMIYMMITGSKSPKYLSGEAFYEYYSFKYAFIHPFKLDGDGPMRRANRNILKNVIMEHGDVLRQLCSGSGKK